MLMYICRVYICSVYMSILIFSLFKCNFGSIGLSIYEKLCLYGPHGLCFVHTHLCLCMESGITSCADIYAIICSSVDMYSNKLTMKIYLHQLYICYSFVFYFIVLNSIVICICSSIVPKPLSEESPTHQIGSTDKIPFKSFLCLSASPFVLTWRPQISHQPKQAKMGEKKWFHIFHSRKI